MKPLTKYPELDNVFKEYANTIQKILGSNFVGFYLQGSLALGDFDLTSDVDFIIVTEQDLSEKQLEEIKEAHERIYNQPNRWVKRLEYSFFPKEKLNQFSSPFSQDKRNDSTERELWYFNNGSRAIERSDHCNTLVTRWTVREKGIAVLGPNPVNLINQIDVNELRKEIKNTLVGWGRELFKDSEPYKNRFYQSYLVLNYCRMLHDLHEGKIDSKLAGMKWAKINLDKSWIPLIDFCWQERQDTSISINQPADHKIFPQSLKFVEYIVEKGKNYEITQ
jgi:hypothetical protein